MTDLPNNRADFARLIDHTLLKPEATRVQVDRHCDECLEYGFIAACVNPVWVVHCQRRLGGSRTAVGTVVGFPLGATPTEVKVYETETAVCQGAREIDMVANLGALIAGEYATVAREIAAVVEAAKRGCAAAVVKVILETRALTDERIILGCRCAVDARADYVKTSTGFHAAGGATVEHVTLLRKHAGPLKVKAAGGIRDLEAARKMLAAGAERIGTSAGVVMMESWPE